MPEFDNEEVTRALMAKLYEQMTAEPDVGQDAMLEDRFISWCSPGIPFTKQDFLFAIRGIGGGDVTADTESIDSESTGDSDAEGGDESGGESGSESGGDGGGLTAGEDVRRRIMGADNWSRMANFVPETDGVFDESGQKKMFDTTAFDQDGSSIATIYRNVLEYSQVASTPLTDEQKEKMERFRNKLTTTEKEEDLMSGEMKEVTKASRLVKRYNQFRKKYIDAAMQYNTKRLNALNSADSAAVQDWALNENLYRQKVEAAYDQWVSAGYKNEVEKMRAYIDQTTRRNLELMKDDLLDKLDKAEMSNPISGASFYWTSVIPARFAFSEGWNTYTFTHNEVESHSKRETNQWDAGGSFMGIGVGGASGSKTETSHEYDTSSFRLSCEVTQVIVSRPWFSTEFLLSDAWRFGPDMPELDNMTERLSDGKRPPEEGCMIAYPTAAIFVRDVSLTMSEFHKESSSLRKEIKGGGAVSLGPLNIGGSYGEGEHEREFESSFDGGTLKIPGMQLIGFRCKLLPKLPNPSEKVEQWS